jgi:CHAT domain-containing protein/Tfp pilus assembly protein PilF
VSRRAWIFGLLVFLCGAAFTCPLRGQPVFEKNLWSGAQRPPEDMSWRRVQELHSAGRTGDAVLLCRALIVLIPSRVELYSYLVGQSKDTDLAEYFDGLIARGPDNPYFYYGKGLALKSQKKFVQSRRFFRLAIELGAAFWEPYGELLTIYQNEGEILEDRASFESMSRRARENPYLIQALGVSDFLLSEYEAALRNLREALRLHRLKSGPASEAKCLLQLSDVYMYLNDYGNCRRAAEEGERAARNAGRRDYEAECLERQAFVATDLGDVKGALSLCNKALEYARAIGLESLETLCDRTLGVIFYEQGRLTQAEEYLDKSLNRYRETRNLRLQDVSLYWLTLLHRDRGNFTQALDCARQALAISRRIGFKTGEAFHLTAIADIQRALGNYERALEFCSLALKVTERYVGKWSREECLNTLGFIYAEQGRFDEALRFFQEALVYIRKIGHLREEEKCLYNVGCALMRLGRPDTAARWLRESLARARQTGKKAVEALAANRLGDLALELGDTGSARRFYGFASGVGNEIGLPQAVWEAYAGMGALSVRLKAPGSAIEFYKKAVEEIEGVRSRFLHRELSIGFFQSKVPIYERLVGLLYERALLTDSQADLCECFSFAERGKARAFLDDLEQARAGFQALHLSAAKTEEIEGASKKISHIFSVLTSQVLDAGSREALRSDLDKAEDDYEFLIESVIRENPESFHRLCLTPCGVRDIQKKLSDAGAFLVEYFVAEERLYLFGIQPGGISVHRFGPEESGVLFELIKNYVRLLSSRAIGAEDFRFAGERLYRLLIAPAAKDFPKGMSRMVVVPDGALNELPFEAIVVPSGAGNPGKGRTRFMMEDYSIVYAPSASTFISLDDVPGDRTCPMDLLAVGDPVFEPGNHKPEGSLGVATEYYENKFSLDPLPFAARELKSLARCIRKPFVDVISRENASEARLKSLRLGDYRVIHFATHGLLDETTATRSALALTPDPGSAEDGFYQAREVSMSKLRAELVVLSACQTARGKQDRGEGVQGIAKAFFCAGTRSVLAALWNINDRSTSEFMRHFYGYLADGLPKQEALRRAKIRMLHSKDSPPYHWAAFVLIGEGRSPVLFHRIGIWQRLGLTLIGS